MKKLIFLALLLQVSLLVKAQMSRWIIKPSCDSIYLAPDVPVLICDSANVTSLWNLQGKRLAATSHQVHSFTEGYAVVTASGSEELKGFYNTKGQLIPLKDLSVAYSYPYFSNGFLLVNNGGFTQFLTPEGELQNFGPYEKFYPFHRGLAVGVKYEDAQKKKNLHYVYINTAQREIPFSLKGKPVDPEDVQFLSSLNEQGEGVAIIKDKVYLYQLQNASLQPLFAGKGAQYQKKQLEVAGNEAAEYLVDMQDSLILRTKASKKEVVNFVFNKGLRPQRYVFMDHTQVFKPAVPQPQTLHSSLSKLEDKAQHKMGLKSQGAVVLPPQFDEVGFCFGDFAVVRQQDKWGLLLYDRNLTYRLAMHGGKAISFRHREVTTDIKLELPAIISADLCRFEVDPSAGCVIDKISIQTKNTENGNYVAYQCKLTIPEKLPDVLTDIQYPVQIKYDDLVYPVVPLTVKAWHYKYINVSLDDSEMKFAQGKVTFAIDVQVDKMPGDDDYPFQLTVKADFLEPELIKISETRYECKLSSLVQGKNSIQVSILEAGCPPSVFPFEIFYVKPVEKGEGTPEVKETVVIGKPGTILESVDQPTATDTTQHAVPTTPAIMNDLIQEVSPM